MILKAGVRLKDLQPQMVLAAMVVDEIYGDTECVITSANDSKHSEKSLHYKGCALDFRTHNYSNDKGELRDRIKAALGQDFDVVLEGVNTPGEHIHLEYDPKG